MSAWVARANSRMSCEDQTGTATSWAFRGSARVALRVAVALLVLLPGVSASPVRASPPKHLSLLVATATWGGQTPPKRFSIQHAVNRAVAWYRVVSGDRLLFGPIAYAPPVSIPEEGHHDNCLSRARRAVLAARAALRREGVEPDAYARALYVIPPF